MVTDARLRIRIYARNACRVYCQRRAKMIARRAEMMRNAAGQATDGWAEHWEATDQD